MDTKNLKLEKSFTNNRLVQQEIDEFKSLLISVNINIEKLRQFFVIRTLEDVKKFGNSKFVKEYLDKGLEEYLGKTFVPSEEKRRISDQYSAVFKETESPAEAVRNFFEIFPFSYTYNGMKLEADYGEVRAYFERKYHTVLSDEDCEYYERICDIMKALQACSDWEKAHNYVNYTLEGDAFNRQDNFFTVWQRGNFGSDEFHAMIGGAIGKIQHHQEED